MNEKKRRDPFLWPCTEFRCLTLPENDTRGKGTPIEDVSQSQGSFSFLAVRL